MLTFSADIRTTELRATKRFILFVNLFTPSFRYFWKIFSKINFSLQKSLTFLHMLLIFLHKHLIRVADRRDLMEPTFSAEISCHAYMISTNAYHCARNRVFPTEGDVVWGSPPHQLKICSYTPPPPASVDSPPLNYYSYTPKVNSTSTK